LGTHPAFGKEAIGGDMPDQNDLRFLAAVARRIDALERMLVLFAGLAVACLLSACATTSMPSVEQGENEGISGYLACLETAARRMDDGRSDVATLAAAIKGVCAARFPEPAAKPGSTMNAAARQKYEQRIQARQMELSTMVVQDVRGQP
jgi:hypothetical protein